MLQVRLLASSLLASALVWTTAAQSTAPQKPGPLRASITAPAMLTPGAQQPISAAAIESLMPRSFTSKDLKGLSVPSLQRPREARDQSPCFTLRSYHFTQRDLKSAHPHASSETDCTPGSRAHILGQATVARSSVVRSAPTVQPQPDSGKGASHN
ncbi:MAG: hypothetical protein ACP5E5_02160 [Acidobacteriaceae bacterium]